jgi:hypothetical protein
MFPFPRTVQLRLFFAAAYYDPPFKPAHINFYGNSGRAIVDTKKKQIQGKIVTKVTVDRRETLPLSAGGINTKAISFGARL